jgi:hypothetical protein
MRTSTFALIAGLFYLALGILGLVPALLVPPPIDAPPAEFTMLYGYLLGLFPMNVLHSLVHIAVGAWGIAAWRGASNPGLFARGASLLFGMLAMLGLIPIANTLFGWMPIHGHGIWLHGLTAVVAAYFGWRSESLRTERRSPRMDRRYRMQPVMQERRLGMPDRRFAHARMLAGV